jgi:hypothetical protein
MHTQMPSGRFYFTSGRRDFYNPIYYIFCRCIMKSEQTQPNNKLFFDNIKKEKFWNPLFHERPDISVLKTNFL